METVPKEVLMEDLLDKYFKTTVIKLLKRLKINVGKVKKIRYDQDENIGKEAKHWKRNKTSEDVIKIIQTLKCTIGIQRQSGQKNE